jgi:serine/threonine-protein kinase
LDALPPVSRVYKPGDVIAGKYQLNRVLGQGGMGEVWVARNRDLDADVAIKLIRSESSADDSADRLLREAQAAARLSGPAIVRVFDFGKTQYGDPYIVMELLEGEDLSHALKRRGRLSPIKAVRIMLPICQALANAHSVGIVHRDLKPENIFLAKTPGGQVQPKLLDFGVAKVGRAFSTRLTQTGAMLGSPLYMSPEHARGDEVDYRADIWAFCVVLYEVITGRAPFDGKNYNAVLYAIIANEPPATTTFGAGDDELWKSIRRGMRKDPDQRWSSMDELGRALARWLLAHDTADDITGVSLQATWLESPGRVSGDLLESMRPPAMDGAMEEVSLGMPAAPSFRAPAMRKRLGTSLSRRHVWARHPLVLSAVIGLLGALLVVLVLKLTASDETTVRPLNRVRELAQRAREFARGAPTAEALPSAEPAAAQQGAPGTDQATAEAAPSSEPAKAAAPATTSKRPSTKKPTVNRLKNPFH